MSILFLVLRFVEVKSTHDKLPCLKCAVGHMHMPVGPSPHSRSHTCRTLSKFPRVPAVPLTHPTCSPAAVDLSFSALVLGFLELYADGISQYNFFWLLSLCIISLQSNYALESISGVFLLRRWDVFRCVAVQQFGYAYLDLWLVSSF